MWREQWTKTTPYTRAGFGQFPSLRKATGKKGNFVIKACFPSKRRGGTNHNKEADCMPSTRYEWHGVRKNEEEHKNLRGSIKIAEASGEDEDEIDVLVPERGTYMWRKAPEIAFYRPDETGVDIWSLDKMPSGDARIRVLGG